MSRATTWAIVPVKSLAQAKQRLKDVLPLEARRRLMLVMLQDVLATLQRVELLKPVVVVTPDATIADLAASLGAQVLRETVSESHSAAASAGFAHARSQGAVRALTLPADAPLVTPRELQSLIEADADKAAPCITLVPNHDGDGTNGILAAPPGVLQPSFGPGSFARHLAQAAERGIACRVHPLPGLALDIDEPADLARLIDCKRDDPRYDFVRASMNETAPAMERL